jgi:hypothetical protein
MGRARARARKIDTRGPMQRLVDAEKIANDQAELDVITPEMKAKGTYTGTRSGIVNNHDPVERWKAAGKLTQGQQVVIEMCQRLWRLAGLSQRVTASYGERMPASVSYELRALTEIEAREDLHRIQDYVPAPYWSIFENCCRHQMPAGIAGGDDRNGAHRAYVVVCFVADVIAMRERV